MSYKVNIIIEKDKYGYYAYTPELEGCQSQGDTYDEALANIKEAIDLYISTLSEDEKKEITTKDIITTTYEAEVA